MDTGFTPASLRGNEVRSEECGQLKSFSSGPALISNAERARGTSAPDGARSNHGCSIAAFKPLREKLAVIKYSGWKTHKRLSILQVKTQQSSLQLVFFENKGEKKEACKEEITMLLYYCHLLANQI